MPIDWDELHKAIYPIKNYEALAERFRAAFSYPLLRETFNFSLPDLVVYTQNLLGGDTRGRYTDYAKRLDGIFSQLQALGVKDVLDLHTRTCTRAQLEEFVTQSMASAVDIGIALQYLAYWFIPSEKYLSGLVRDKDEINRAIKVLGSMGVKTNLEMLQRGSSAAGRKALAEASGLPLVVVEEVVNRADFSRMPWASKATISNITGAGYHSIAELANAEPEQLYADFFSYGERIGKNLKLGNEIENSYRIAKIVPILLDVG